MVARVPLLMVAPLLGLICMGIADCSACSAGEALGKLGWVRVMLTSALSSLQLGERGLLGDLFVGKFAVPSFTGLSWLGRSSGVDAWTQSRDFRPLSASWALPELYAGGDELPAGCCQE